MNYLTARLPRAKRESQVVMKNHPIPDVGRIIRELRTEQDLPLRTLARRCGLSINAISRIERGESSPTVSSLHRLATGLNVSITSLFREEVPETALFVEHNQGTRYHMEDMTMESLGSGLPRQQLEPFLIQVEPGSMNGESAVTHRGEEFVHCLEGEIEYCVSDRVYLMHAGDSLIFKASQPHYWNNPGKTVAKMILVFQTSQAGHLHRHP